MIPVSANPSINSKSLTPEQATALFKQSPPKPQTLRKLLGAVSIRERDFLKTSVPYWRNGRWVLLVHQSDAAAVKTRNIVAGLIAIHLHLINNGYVTNTHHDSIADIISEYTDNLARSITTDLSDRLLASVEDHDPTQHRQ